jgi:hypothetical protein
MGRPNHEEARPRTTRRATPGPGQDRPEKKMDIGNNRGLDAWVPSGEGLGVAIVPLLYLCLLLEASGVHRMSPLSLSLSSRTHQMQQTCVELCAW